MTEIKSLSAPALGERELARLVAFCTPKRMTSASTLFDTGYEQAKRDMAEMLRGFVVIPHEAVEPGTVVLVEPEAGRKAFFDKWRRR